MKKQKWLTDNSSNTLSRQGANEGAEEGATEHVHQESNILVLAGGVQQTRNFRDQIGY